MLFGGHTDFNTATCKKNKRAQMTPLLVSLLFRYHPIDDEDDITETSAEGGSNNVVLRSKLQQKTKIHSNTLAHK